VTSPVLKARTRRRRRLSGAAVVIVALSTMGMLYAALAPSGQAAQSADPAVERGSALFREGCSSCHGLNGEGSSYAPSLIGVGAAAVDFQVGTGRMPLQQQGPQAPRKQPRYTDKEIRDLATYVASLAPGPAIPDFATSGYKDADLALGGELFRTNCSQCHNFAGAGGALSYGKYAPTLTAATPKQIYEAMVTGPENMPTFGDKVLTPDQKLAVVKYVKSVTAEANPGGAGLGRVGPVSEGLVAWIGGIGILVIATLWIGARA
jgi:ubiquinol-cytochrome c reductase cytochrome c subunit